MSTVIVKESETLDSALRRFKRSCAKAGIQQEIRKREHYEKPSVKRKKKSEAARKNNLEKANISKICNNYKTKKYKTKHQTCGGFKWKFRD